MKQNRRRLESIVNASKQHARKTACLLAIGISAPLLFSACGTLEPEGPDPRPANAAECEVISWDAYSQVQGLGLANKRFAYYCKRCNDKTPQGPFVIRSMSYKAVSSPRGSWGSLVINNQALDPSSVFIETSSPNFENLVLVTRNATGQLICDPKIYQKKIVLN